MTTVLGSSQNKTNQSFPIFSLLQGSFHKIFIKVFGLIKINRFIYTKINAASP
jgi:hypothetical protein